MPADDSSLYGLKRKRNLNNGTEISSSTTLAFTSQLSSLISSSSSSSSASAPRTSAGRARPKKKPDIFSTHNRNVAQRAARDLAPDHAGTFAQVHTTSGPALDASDWARSQRKLEDKARLYAAIKRGDLDDADERYAVDFDRKWAESRDRRSASPISSSSSSNSDASGPQNGDKGRAEEEQIEYTDEFGRTRLGTRLEASIAAHAIARSSSSGGGGAHDDRFTARPSAPATLIRGDAVQFEAFNPDATRAEAMARLAAKRDRSLTPPREEHFDGAREVRTKGTGWFQFSRDEEERKRQMEGLEGERRETVRVRGERVEGGGRGEKEGRGTEKERRRAMLERRREEVLRRGAKRKAEEFLEEMGMGTGTEMTGRIEEAIRREREEDSERAHEGS